MNRLKIGDEVWACAFRMSKKFNRVKFNLRPTKGILAGYDMDTRPSADGKKDPVLFLPYNEDGNPIYKNRYWVDVDVAVTRTEEDARAAYRKYVLDAVRVMLDRAQGALSYIGDAPSDWAERTYGNLSRSLKEPSDDGWTVGFAVDGRYYVHVSKDAETVEEARALAESAMMFDAEMGLLECIGWKPVNCEDPDGNLVDLD